MSLITFSLLVLFYEENSVWYALMTGPLHLNYVTYFPNNVFHANKMPLGATLPLCCLRYCH